MSVQFLDSSPPATAPVTSARRRQLPLAASMSAGLEIDLCFHGTGIQVRRQVAASHCLPELQAQEGTRGVPGYVEVVPLHQSLDHMDVFVGQFRRQGEAVVVHHAIDLVTDGVQPMIDSRTDAVDIRMRAHRQSFEIDEEEIPYGVIAEALLEWQVEQGRTQVHRSFGEDPLVHQGRLGLEHRPKTHAGQDVALDVDARGNLDEFEALGAESEHAPLRDVQHRGAAAHRFGAAEGSMFDALHELVPVAIMADRQHSLMDRDLDLSGTEGTDEHHFLCVLADVDETARACQPPAELRNVEITFPVGLRKAQKGNIQPTAIVEIELAGLVDDGLGIDGGAKVESAGGKIGRA